MNTFELSILDHLQAIKCPALDYIMPKISFLGNAGWLWIVIALILLLIKKHRKHGVRLATALILCLVLCNLILKNLIARARPNWINKATQLLISNPTDYSFPSGHTLSSFAAAFVIYRLDKRFGIIAYIIASLIAFSRMYLYVHFPTDVLAGIILGTLFGFVVVKTIKS